MSMRMNTKGYAGIIVLLITFLIISFLLVRPDVFTGDKKTKGTLETGIDAVDEAKQVVRQSQERNGDTIRLSE